MSNMYQDCFIAIETSQAGDCITSATFRPPNWLPRSLLYAHMRGQVPWNLCTNAMLHDVSDANEREEMVRPTLSASLVSRPR